MARLPPPSTGSGLRALVEAEHAGHHALQAERELQGA